MEPHGAGVSGMNDKHIPAPVEHRERPTLVVCSQTDGTITLYESENPDTEITTDTLVDVRQ